MFATVAKYPLNAAVGTAERKAVSCLVTAERSVSEAQHNAKDLT